jgi:HK97 gp10 family phage protein
MAAPVFQFHSRIPQARLAVNDIIRAVTADVFELDIKPAAAEASPVTEEGYLRNLELEAEGKLGGRSPMGTGHNRRSIDVTVRESDKGVEATLFTQSGYGGYLETGTSKMRAQPYLYPAFIQHIHKLPEGVEAKIQTQEQETKK